MENSTINAIEKMLCVLSIAGIGFSCSNIGREQTLYGERYELSDSGTSAWLQSDHLDVVPELSSAVKELFLEGSFTDLSNITNTNVEYLDLRNCTYKEKISLMPVSDMTKLKILLIPFFPITNINFIGGLQLETLDISYSNVISLEPLRGMKTLRYLSIPETPICCLEPLKGMDIEILDLDGTVLTNCNILKSLHHLQNLIGPTVIDAHFLPKSLKILRLGSSDVLYIEEIARLPNLEKLSVPRSVSDISFVAGLKNLQEIRISKSRVDDLSPLRGLPLNVIFMSGSKVNNLEPLTETSVETVFADHCQIKSLSGLRPCQIRFLDLSNCPLKSLIGIENLAHLEEIDISGTNVEIFETLKNIDSLIKVIFSTQTGERKVCYRSQSSSKYWNLFFNSP